MKMPEEIDFLDLKTLEALSVHGPRNITHIARKLGIPAETMRKRLKRLGSQIFLKFHANIYHTSLGLKKAVVFAEAVPGHEDLLFHSFKMNDFWIFVSRYYGMVEGCAGIYTIPVDHEEEFQQFLEEVRKMEVAKDVRVFWSTCFQAVHSKCNWYDPKSETWDFKWDEWIEEISTKEDELPQTLIDPEDWPMKAEEMDIFILKELEKDATVSFTDLAKMLGVSPQLVRYHWQKHLIKRNLIESFDVSVFHFGRAASDMFFFILTFDTMEKLAQFALSLLDKPFVRTVGKILGKKALYLHIYIPRSEFRKFIDSLSRLVRKGLLQRYWYAIQDLEKSSRQTISYEYFKGGQWIYDHKRHIENLRELVKQTESINKQGDKKGLTRVTSQFLTLSKGLTEVH